MNAFTRSTIKISATLAALGGASACSSKDNPGAPADGGLDSSSAPDSSLDAGGDTAVPAVDSSAGDTSIGDATPGSDGSVDGSAADGGSGMPIGIVPPYTVTVWATGTKSYKGPDSIDSDGTHIWVGYQNKTTKDGSDGGAGFGPTSTIVEYSLDGQTVLATVPLAGHVDGVRVDPATKDVWVTSNEDGNAHLFKIDHTTIGATEYTIPTPLPHGGGLDDLGFVGGKMFIAASAPVKSPNTDPALYVVTTSGSVATFTSAFAGNVTASDYASDAGVTLNLQDPDSITINAGQLVMASQGDSQLLFVTNPGAGATQTIAALTVATQLDDTVWATKTAGQLLVVDGKGNTIYSVRKTGGFTVGDVYTETPDDSTIPNILGTLSLTTGTVSPIAVGFGKATGLFFLADP